MNDIKSELGKIGVRGGHACGDNVLDSSYGYLPYNEGDYVHDLSIALSEAFGWENLEPEETKLEWSTIAERGSEAGCDTILYNHTNFSTNSKGELNSGLVVIIYPFENEEYKPVYEKMAEIIAKHMNLPKWETRIRMSEKYENKNYYSAIHYGKKHGIKHPLIVEYGYHVDVAGKEDERTRQIIKAYQEILSIEVAPDSAEEPKEQTIRVNRTRLDGKVHVMKLESEYLPGVVGAEIGKSFPPEAQKAQAITSRSYAMYQINHCKDRDFDVWDTTKSQSFRPEKINDNSNAAIAATSGLILTYKDEVAETVYSKANGGRQVASVEKWGKAVDYLPAQVDTFDNYKAKKMPHGVGMSQLGAKARAEAGQKFKKILAFYFPGTVLGHAKDYAVNHNEDSNTSNDTPGTIDEEPIVSTAYKVVSGDNLGRIAKRHGVTLEEILKVNPQIKNPNLIRLGDTINIPENAPITNFHIVVAGDNITKIAKNYGVTKTALLAANPQIKNPNKIYIGDSINIPK